MKLKMPSLFYRKRPVFSRSSQRYTCNLASTLVVSDRMVTFEGRVTDFSTGGAQFRPKLAYLMDRRDVPVTLAFGGIVVAGRIVSTSPAGFGLRFDEPLSDADVAQLLSMDKPVVTVPSRSEEDAAFFVID